MEGTPLTQICRDKGFPSLSKVYNWCAENKEFAQKIMNARRIGSQTYLDKMITELESADNKSIMIIREKLHHYRWLASKLLPLYSDRKEVQVDQKIEITWSDDNQMKTVDENSGSIHDVNEVSHTT